MMTTRYNSGTTSKAGRNGAGNTDGTLTTITKGTRAMATNDSTSNSPKRKIRRRRTSSQQPCACCGYPITDRHHLLSFAKWGEHRYTIRLCPNCHRAFHIIHRFIRENPPEYAFVSKAACDLIQHWGKDDHKTVYILKLADYALSLETAALKHEGLVLQAIMFQLGKD